VTRILLIRHGQTAWNVKERFRGREDLPLDDVGRAQAGALAQLIANEWPSITAIYASPLQRAVATAQPAAQALHLDLVREDGLLDIDYGLWQGLTPEEASSKYPSLFHLWNTSPEEVQFPNGESLCEVQKRARECVDRLAARNQGQVIVVVSHLQVCRVLLCSVLGLSLRSYGQFRLGTSGISVIETSHRGYDIITVNDTHHLRDVGCGQQ
jgi:phosphoserine phosphatase